MADDLVSPGSSRQSRCTVCVLVLPSTWWGGETVLVPCGLDTSGRNGALLNVEPHVAVLLKPSLSMCCVHAGHRELT